MAGDFDDDFDNSPDGDPNRRRFKTHHDWEESTDLSATIIDAVSAVIGREPTDIEPLYEVVDPDALDQLLLSLRPSDGNHPGRREVKFIYNGCQITAESSGDIWIEPADIHLNDSSLGP